MAAVTAQLQMSIREHGTYGTAALTSCSCPQACAPCSTCLQDCASTGSTLHYDRRITDQGTHDTSIVAASQASNSSTTCQTPPVAADGWGSSVGKPARIAQAHCLQANFEATAAPAAAAWQLLPPPLHQRQRWAAASLCPAARHLCGITLPLGATPGAAPPAAGQISRAQGSRTLATASCPYPGCRLPAGALKLQCDLTPNCFRSHSALVWCWHLCR